MVEAAGSRRRVVVGIVGCHFMAGWLVAGRPLGAETGGRGSTGGRPGISWAVPSKELAERGIRYPAWNSTASTPQRELANVLPDRPAQDVPVVHEGLLMAVLRHGGLCGGWGGHGCLLSTPEPVE